MAARTRPVLRYHGGKHVLAPWIISNFPTHRVYVEPFCGAASVLMAKPRSYSECINDLDGEIVNVFKVLRDPASALELQRQIELTPYSRTEFKGAYVPSRDPVEQARRTIVKSFMGFGSAAVTQAKPTSPGAGFKPTTGFRANSNRSGTTPSHDWANWPRRIPSFVERLQGVVIENKDASAIMLQHDSERTLHYVDPPYVHSTRGLKQWRTPQSYRYEMTDEQHAELADVLKSLQGFVVLSGYPSELYDRLYEGWACVKRDAHGDGAVDRVECLWLSPSLTERAQPQLMEVR